MNRRDLIGGAAAIGAAATALAGTVAIAAQAAPASPDAKLIRVCDQHMRNLEAFNREGGEVDPEQDPLWHAYRDTLDAVRDIRATTMEGVLAKARVAVREATDLDGSLMWEGTVGSRWALETLADLLRIAGGGA